MKKVMLLGDSIRLGYRAKVAKLLEGQAMVAGPEENCRFSAYTLFKRYISADMVHLTEDGNELCARLVA